MWQPKQMSLGIQFQPSCQESEEQHTPDQKETNAYTPDKEQASSGEGNVHATVMPAQAEHNTL
ncbi:hypothetical protein PGIGA_G00233260, partial [Pangasianodon gigas]|nr:hypothetical protein [Pangasianodon gigas]